MDTEKKRQQERMVVLQIIGLYCQGHHHRHLPGEPLCPDCQQIADYAIHCYARPQQEQILRIMRYGGPRMLLHHPLMALHHMLLGWQTRH